VVEFLPPPAEPSDGEPTTIDAGGLAIGIPSATGREVTPSGKAIGVIELADGNWFITTSTERGGVYDPDTGEKLSETPSNEHRRFIEPLFVRTECLDASIDAAGANADDC
jgi:hypothetical protein